MTTRNTVLIQPRSHNHDHPLSARLPVRRRYGAAGDDMIGKGRRRWQRAETELARMLGTERIPNNGFGQPDFKLPVLDGDTTLAVQVKTKASLPSWFTDAMSQATLDADNTEGDAIPAVAYVLAPGQGKKKSRYLVLKFEDAVRLIAPKEDE